MMLPLELAGVSRASADALVIAAGPMSGPHAAEGQQINSGLELAAEDINASGGVLGETVRVAAIDDGCAGERAAASAGEVAKMQPVLVVGHPCSSAAIAAARIYAAAGILFITPGARHPALTDKRPGPTVFRLAGRDDQQGAAAARWLAAASMAKRVALIHDRTAYARGLIETARTHLAASGLTEVPTFGIVAGEKDYRAAVARLKASNPEAVFFAGYPAEAEIILRTFRDEGVTAAFLGSDSLRSWSPQGPASIENGTLSVLVPFRLERLASAALLARLEAKAIVPDGPLLSAYAALQAWASAARASGTLQSDEASRWLSARTIPTALGMLAFDDKGDVSLPSYEVETWSNGRWQALN